MTSPDDVPVRVLLDLSFNTSLDQPVAAPWPISSVPAPNIETDLQLLFGTGYEKCRTFNAPAKKPLLWTMAH